MDNVFRCFLKRCDCVENLPAAALSFRKISVGRIDRFQHGPGNGTSGLVKRICARSSQCVDHQYAAVVAGNSDGEQALRLRHRYAHTLRHCGGRLFVQLLQGHPLDISRGAFDLFYLAFVGVFVWVAFTAPLSVGQQLLIGRFIKVIEYAQQKFVFPQFQAQIVCVVLITIQRFHFIRPTVPVLHGLIAMEHFVDDFGRQNGDREVVHNLPYRDLLALKANGGVCAEIVAFFNVHPVIKAFFIVIQGKFQWLKARPDAPKIQRRDRLRYPAVQFIQIHMVFPQYRLIFFNQ